MKLQYARLLPLPLLAGSTTGAAPARMYTIQRRWGGSPLRPTSTSGTSPADSLRMDSFSSIGKRASTSGRLHIVLTRDVDDLMRMGLCPLRLLASCPRASTPTRRQNNSRGN
jgi:hypothetical protein